jgi:hypothetical protein
MALDVLEAAAVAAASRRAGQGWGVYETSR